LRILIIRPDKIGDVILTLPMATAIKSAMPDAHVAFLVSDYTAPLFSLASDVDEVVNYDRNLSLKKTIALIRSAKPNAIFIFGHKFKLTLASFLARAPIRVGRASWWFSFLYNKRVYEHRKKAKYNEAEYNIRMLKEIGIESSTKFLPNFDKNKLPEKLFSSEDYIVLHLPTGGSAPHWSDNHFLELARDLKQKYDFPIILTGLESDHNYLYEVAKRMKQSGIDVHIKTQSSLIELAAILASAKLVVSGSTGPGHIAGALGTPAVGIFPGVVALSKERWGFRGKRVKNLSPLVMPKNECPQCKDCICINEVTVKQVMEAIENLKIS
jgi:heptosyltransferase-3